METGNFNDQPSTKVGNYGGMCVKSRLTKAAGYTLLPPPQIYPNGGSPVDNMVEFSYNGYNSVTYFAEYITRRQKKVRNTLVITIESAKVERLKNLLDKHPDKYIEIYVVDISKEFGLSDSEPAIYEASLAELLKVREIDNVQFPIEDEIELPDGTKKIFMCFHIKQFTHFDNLTDDERSNLKKLFDEMDAAKKKDSVSAEPSAPPSYNRRLNWTRDTLTAEANLFSELEGDKVTEEHVTDDEIAQKFIRIKLKKKIKQTNFETHRIDIFLTNENLNVISSGDIARAMTCTNGSIVGGRGNIYGDSIRAVLIEHSDFLKVYTTSSQNSQSIFGYFDVKDVPKVIDTVIKAYEKRESLSVSQQRIYEAALRFKAWYEKKIFHRYAQVKRTESITKPPEKKAEVKTVVTPIESNVAFTSAQIKNILNRAEWFKKQGMNGQSLTMAIKLVAEDEKINAAPILELVKFVQQELMTSADAKENVIF